MTDPLLLDPDYSLAAAYHQSAGDAVNAEAHFPHCQPLLRDQHAFKDLAVDQPPHGVTDLGTASIITVHCDRFALTPDMRPAAVGRRSMLGLLRGDGGRTMETVNEISTVTARRRPWNKGKLIGPKPPLQSNHVRAIRTRLQLAGRTRDLALFNRAIDSKLRGCDLVSLKVEDVAPHGYAIDRATVRQNKTGLPVRAATLCPPSIGRS
jgi:hypothetical protein